MEPIHALILAITFLLGGLIHQTISNSRDNVYILFNHHIGIVWGWASLAWSIHLACWRMATPLEGTGTGSMFYIGSLFVSDIIHHHCALGVIGLVATHFYNNSMFSIGHVYSMEEYTYLYNWESQLSVNLAVLGSWTIVVGHHLNAIPPYNYISIDYSTVISLFTHHIWIGGFCIVGAATHGSISIIRSIPTVGLVDRLLFYRDIIIYQLNYVCLFFQLDLIVSILSISKH